jgi:DNA helicase-2/ATP-dependent DNA helicase PcrA
VKKDAQMSVSVGDVIVHERFGRGRVIATADTGVDAKATVEFENAGVKQLLLRFAKFTKAE